MQCRVHRSPWTVIATLLLATAELWAAASVSAAPLQLLSDEFRLNIFEECRDIKKLIRQQTAAQTTINNALNNCRARRSCYQFRIDDLNNSIDIIEEDITSLLTDYYDNCAVGLKPARSSWIQLTPTGPLPPKRWEHKSVYDARSNRMIMFGGKIPANDYADDVWVLQGANGLHGNPSWIQLTPGGRRPMGRHDGL
jgi:hypothetical protein